MRDPLHTTQAIQGRVNEAKIGVAANATAIGEGWAHNHLRSWRRHLSRKSSGIGMAGVVEGAERQAKEHTLYLGTHGEIVAS